MYRFLLKPIAFYEADDAAIGGGEVSPEIIDTNDAQIDAVETVADDTAASTQEPDLSNLDINSIPAEKLQELLSSNPSSVAKRFREMNEPLQNKVKELEDYKQKFELLQQMGFNPQQQTPTQETPYPALAKAGLQPDEYGNVELDGVEIAASVANRILAAEQNAAAFTTWQAQQEEQAKQAATASAWAQASNTLESVATESIKSAIPGLPDDSAKAFQDVLLSKASAEILELAQNTGIPDEALMRDVVTRNITALKTLFGVFGNQQLKTNQQLAGQQYVGANGAAATTAPKEWNSMSEQEQEAAMRQQLENIRGGSA